MFRVKTLVTPRTPSKGLDPKNSCRCLVLTSMLNPCNLFRKDFWMKRKRSRTRMDLPNHWPRRPCVRQEAQAGELWVQMPPWSFLTQESLRKWPPNYAQLLSQVILYEALIFFIFIYSLSIQR